ncbi:MAG TPA: hypothetical protein VLA12_16840, partial [Planctomycetaceae bacterium]|nr:hypothetical protein [Planctomycetaceae bacterium]
LISKSQTLTQALHKANNINMLCCCWKPLDSWEIKKLSKKGLHANFFCHLGVLILRIFNQDEHVAKENNGNSIR